MKTDYKHSEHNETENSSLGGSSSACLDHSWGANSTESQSKINKTEEDTILQQGDPPIGESQRPRRGLLRNATASCRTLFKRNSISQPLRTASSCRNLFKRDSTSNLSLREEESESPKTATSSRLKALMRRQPSGRSLFSYNEMMLDEDSEEW
jgi:hypothetical protein